MNGFASATDLGDTAQRSDTYEPLVMGTMGGALQVDVCRGCGESVELDTDGMGSLIQLAIGGIKRHRC